MHQIASERTSNSNKLSSSNALLCCPLILCQLLINMLAFCIAQINLSSVAFPGKEENRTGVDDTENEIEEDEGLLNQNSNIPVIDTAERELPKELDENLTCEAPINTFDKTIDDSEVKKEQQEEHITRKHEILPLPELVQGKDSEKYNQKDEICGLDEVQPRDEVKYVMHLFHHFCVNV